MTTRRPNADADELAARLQTSLRRRRLKPTLIVLATLALSVISLGFLAWSLYPGPEPPPLQVLALDGAFNADETPKARARIVTAGEGQGEPRGHEEVIFLDNRAVPVNVALQPEKTSTDAAGFAAAVWPHASFLARHVDTRRRQGSSDVGRIFVWPRATALVLVEVEEVLVPTPTDGWDKVTPPALAIRAGAKAALRELDKEGRHIVYVIRTDKTAAYRAVRTWLHNHLTTAGLPLGPIVGHPSFDKANDIRQAAVQELRAHFSSPLVAVGVRASDYEPLQVKAVSLSDGKTWADVPGLLRQLEPR